MRTEKLEKTVNIAIFDSGEGINTENIVKYFEPFLDATVSCVITNKENAGVIKKLRRYRIPVYYTKWYKEMDQILTKHNVHYIVLSDYRDKIPPNFCKKYKNKMINIHPSLLPNFGGKGMYGDKVHIAVKNSGVNKTGITIHLVNEEYNKGNIIFQKSIKITENDTLEDIKSKVNELELKFYPVVIEKFIKGTYKMFYEQ